MEPAPSVLDGCVANKGNDRYLTVMLQTYAHNVRAEAILFEDGFRPSSCRRAQVFARRRTWIAIAYASWIWMKEPPGVIISNGVIAGAGGVLYHYNPPCGDIYIEVAEPFRRPGFGSYHVQQLKSMCRGRDKIPAARCNVKNLAGRRTLQNAGFSPCGNIIVDELPT
jgi:hypothetical protein